MCLQHLVLLMKHLGQLQLLLSWLLALLPGWNPASRWCTPGA
jgi:hypothetical protein